ncbi:MAG: hypothetical protein ACTMII_07015 [Brachybacterium sp.]|uniref:hypothetical protein n=1 Tax=unclassified Brachybacterium TaxID=2623841 RepID=UPI003FD91471
MSPQTEMSPQSAVPGAVPEMTVLPLRFSADVPAMIDFLCTLGMTPTVTAGEDGFGELVAGAGRVMVHAAAGAATGARSGDTDLCLAVEETDVAAHALQTAGYEVDVWDETYGRQGVVTGPAGEQVALNEEQIDLYGYRGHDASSPDPRLTVTAVLSSDGFHRDATWAAPLGFSADGPDDEWFLALRGPGRAGVLGLHKPGPLDRRTRSTGTEFGDVLQVRLGFETTGDLAELSLRLTTAGHPAEVVESGALRSVHVTDPDGQHLEIHQRPLR